MRIVLLAVFAALPTRAGAIGLCEGLTDATRFVALSEPMRQVAVKRTVEVCAESPSGEEARHMLEYLEIWDLRGKVVARYAPSALDGPKMKALRAAVPDVRPAGAWAAAQKAGRFHREGQGLDNRRCRVAVALEAGTLEATVTREGRKEALTEVTLGTDVDPADPPTVKAWWMRTGAVLVIDVEATTVIDQGPLGTDSGSLETVFVVREDALLPCAHPIQRAPKPPPAAAKSKATGP